MAISALADDWEDVSEMQTLWDDDAPSIHSMSTSDETDSFLHFEDEPSELKSASGTIPSRPHGLDEHSSDDYGKSICPEETTLHDLLQIDVDATLLLGTVRLIMDTLRDTIAAVVELNQKGKCSITGNLDEECGKLLSQLTDLEELLSCYSKSWKAVFDDVDNPLDPSLHKWTTNLVEIVSGLQTEVEEALKTVSHESDNASLERYYSSICEFREDIDGFLPIVKVDLYEFITPDLDFPSASSQHQSYRGDKGLNHRRSANGIFTLRKSLYALKDELQSCIQRIQSCKLALPSDVIPMVNKFHAEQTATCATLSILLTNNGSEWIENQLNGGLTYHEFCQLDIDLVHDCTSHVRAMNIMFDTSGKLPDPVEGDNKDEGGVQVEVHLGKVHMTRRLLKQLNRKVKAEVKYEEDNAGDHVSEEV